MESPVAVHRRDSVRVGFQHGEILEDSLAPLGASREGFRKEPLVRIAITNLLPLHIGHLPGQADFSPVPLGPAGTLPASQNASHCADEVLSLKPQSESRIWRRPPLPIRSL